MKPLSEIIELIEKGGKAAPADGKLIWQMIWLLAQHVKVLQPVPPIKREKVYYNALTLEENADLQNVLRRCDEGGNDGADVYEAQEFAKRMTEQYGPFWEMTKEPKQAPVAGPKKVNELLASTQIFIDKQTAKSRLILLNKLKAAPGQENRAMITHFLIVKKWIGPHQTPDYWPLETMPKDDAELLVLAEEIDQFNRIQRCSHE